jgi:hypothetical protein
LRSHAGIVDGRIPLVPTNANAVIGGLGLARAVVDRAALDGWAHHFAGPRANRDHQIGFSTVWSQLKAAPIHQRPFYILAGGAVGHGIVERLASVGVDHQQRNFLLVLREGRYDQQRGLQDQREACSHRSFRGHSTNAAIILEVRNACVVATPPSIECARL